jgi:signal transduction histidine kinase
MDAERSELRVLVVAPLGRDGDLISQVLGQVRISCHVCQSVDELLAEMGNGAGAAVVAQEALSAESISNLTDFLNSQPPWSDFPVIVLTSGGSPSDAALRELRMLEPIGNLTLVERPVRPQTLLSSVRSALRARGRQYEIRAKIDELVRAQNDLRRSNEDLQQFAYAASHDLQEPLRMVGSYVQLLEKRYKGKLDPDADEYIALASSGVTRMFRLIGDLLSYSRVGTSESQLETINVNDVMLWAKMNLQTAISESGAQITHDPMPTVVFDQSQLLQLFQNIIGNAIKYRSQETPRVHVGATRNGNEWVFSVRDNGQGFDPKYADRIFGVFKRLHGRDVPGTGIGLALCKRIVEKHGGRIWAESQLGSGSTFYFSVPVRETLAATG